MALSEDRLLAHIAAQAQREAGVLVGPGDDAAVVALPDGRQLLLSVDQLVEGRHYDPSRCSPEQIAHKAVARAVSDIAAMAGRPRWCLVAAALSPQVEQDEAQALVDAARRRAAALGCPLVGGDVALTEGATTLTTTVVGEVVGRPPLRSGARPGQRVYVTGAVGAALKTGWHLDFQPRVAEAQALAEALGENLGAMIDVSDGLGKDAARVARASGAQIVLEAQALPLRDAAQGDWRCALSCGEDYELLFTASAPPPATVGPAATPVTRIGCVRPRKADEPLCAVRTPDGQLLDAGGLGWEHRA